MNFYIDFDNTLYNTKALTIDMLSSLAKYISEAKGENEEKILSHLKSKFNRKNIYNIFSLCEYFEVKYNMDVNELQLIIKQILENGDKYVYEDVPEFLECLKKDNKLTILTAAAGKDNIDYQELKVCGSGITKYFNNIMITAESKDELNLNYSNGIFIDDNPNDLMKLYNAGAKTVIRIRRPEAKYSEHELGNLYNSYIQEYNSLSEIECKYKNRNESEQCK